MSETRTLNRQIKPHRSISILIINKRNNVIKNSANRAIAKINIARTTHLEPVNQSRNFIGANTTPIKTCGFGKALIRTEPGRGEYVASTAPENNRILDRNIPGATDNALDKPNSERPIGPDGVPIELMPIDVTHRKSRRIENKSQKITQPLRKFTHDLIPLSPRPSPGFPTTQV